MRSVPYSKDGNSAPPRKKACKSCTKSKVRCDLERPACFRCRTTGRTCEYTVPNTGGTSEGEGSHSLAGEPMSTDSLFDPSVIATPSVDFEGNTMPIPLSQSDGYSVSRSPRPIARSAAHRRSDTSSIVNLRVVDLAPSFNAEDIRDRWLRPYILPPLGREEVPKVYHPFTLQYISRILVTYPRCMLKDGGLPPIIHPVQIAGDMPRALANCYTLVRMWEQAVPGSEAIVINTVEKEMERLGEEPPSQHDFERLAAFQAYLIYSIMMYFSPLSEASVVSDKTMITLMELAFRTACNGLFCEAELSYTRPTWASWIVVAAKRRAILAMYLFSSVYNTDRLLPNFLSEELRNVYVPESKSLWNASDRGTWEREYDRHLLDWEDGMLQISELWRSAETGSIQRRKRIERWAQNMDEFGMTLFAVCAHIHGC